MQRLFSTFARGLPGIGLLLMRLVAGIALIVRGFMGVRTTMSGASVVLEVLAIAAGVTLVAGLWTPISGCLAGVLAVWEVFWHARDPWSCVFLATIGVALALLGPGAWSVDARLFGWKRIDLHDRTT